MADRSAPKAVNGVLDLRDWDFRRDGPVRLNGQWAMYWQRLPADLGNAAPVYLQLPGSWTGRVVNDVTLPAEGYATYRLRLLLPPHIHGLAVRTDSAGTAFELLVDGQRVTGNGTVGTSRDSSRPEYRNAVTVLAPLGEQSDWMLAVSNFHYRKGGPWNAVELGTAPDMMDSALRQYGRDLFLLGSVLIMGLYHFVVFTMRRKDRSALYYALLCVVVGARQASTSGRFVQQLWPDMPWGVLIRAEFISFFLCISAGGLLGRALFPADIPRWPVRTMVLGGLGTSAVTLFVPPLWSSYFINPYQFFTLAGCAYLLWGFSRALRNGREGAPLLLFGGALLAAATANDVLYNLEVFRVAYLVPMGLVAFTFTQAVVLSRRFVRGMITAETLTESLERKVEERTQELAAKNQQLEGTITDLTATRKQLQQVGLSVRIGADYQVFSYSDIQYISAREGKTVIHTRDREHEVSRPLKEIEVLLSGEVFQRIHRQCIVNVSCVENMAHIGNGTYVATLRGRKDSALPVSRVHAPALKQRLGIPD